MTDADLYECIVSSLPRIEGHKTWKTNEPVANEGQERRATVTVEIVREE